MDFSLWERRMLDLIEADLSTDRHLAAMARLLDPERRTLGARLRRASLRLRYFFRRRGHRPSMDT